MAAFMAFSCVIGGAGTAIAEGLGNIDLTNGSVSVGELEVNGSAEPLGIDDATPAFSWVLASEARGKSQSAYQIVVKKGEEVIWDSGKVSSANNYGVLYGGKTALQSKTRYEWTVTVWDEDDTQCCSASSHFETGIMSESDWNSSWIGEPSLQTSMNFTGANWIWDREGKAENDIPAETRYFRRTFTLDGNRTAERVQIAMSADDKATLYLNGVSVVSTSEVEDAWKTAAVTTVSAQTLNESDNVIAVEATNTANGYAGFLAKIEVYYSDSATPVTYVTDNLWKIGGNAEDGWTEIGFNDSAWKTPVSSDVISYGSSPWGDQVSFAGSDRAAILLRKEFSTADKTVDYARAYIAGLGLFELKINGQNPDDSVLNPANTDYDETVLYNVFDVTDLICSGENAICVELGNGFYNESITGWNWNNASWRDTPRMRFELDIVYTDGTSAHIASDTSWKVSKDGPTISNSIYSGETFDARKDAEFSSVVYDDSAWQNASAVTAPKGELVWQDMEPMRKTAFFGTAEGAEDGLTVSYTSTIGKWTVKVPRNIAGWGRIEFHNTTAGQQIVIDYAETLASDGNLNLKTESDGTTQRDVYICKGVSGDETEVYEPKFNYKGFQYMQISGYDGTLTEDDVTCFMINTDVASTSSFTSSNEMLNTLHTLMTNTLLNNFQGKPTDTPWLEKNGWLGDVNIAIETMGYDFDIARFMTKFLRDIRDSQVESGSIPQLVPNSGSANTTNAPVWNTVYIFAVQELVETYGMGYLVEEYYDSLKMLADLDVNTISGSGWIWSDQYLLGDWSSPVSTLGNGEVAYDEEPVDGGAFAATAYVYQMLGVMEDYAQRLGFSQDAESYRSARGNILTAFNARYLKNGYYETTEWASAHAHNRTTYRQTSNILPLAFGMVPEESVGAVVSNLVKDIVSKDYHLDTGIIGTKYILSVLCDFGYSDVAYRILTQETYPSWGYWLGLGATSLWEMWESTSRSHNHYFLGTYDAWFFSYLGGIKNVKDGYASFTIDPLLVGDLTNVDISLNTVRGTLSVSWSYTAGNRVRFDIIVPFGSTAELYLPTAYQEQIDLDGETLTSNADGIKAVTYDAESGKVKITLGGGTYRFNSPLDQRTNYTGSLSQIVADAESLSEEDYQAAGWSAFDAALNSAKSVLNSSAATQEEINGAASELSAAMESLQAYVNANRVALKKMIAEVKASDVMDPYYTAGALETFRNALNAANAASKNAALTEEDMANELKTFEEALDQLLSFRKYNLAKDRAVTASSSVSNGDWDIAKLVDGNTSNAGASGEICGWSSDNLTKEQHEEWVQIDLGFAYRFDKILIYTCASSLSSVAYGMPRDFVIEISDDGVNYQTIVSEENYLPRVCGEHAFTFTSVRARYIRVRGITLNAIPTDGNQYRMQFAEIQVFNTPAADLSALTALVEQYNSLERNLYTTDSLLVLEDAMETALAVLAKENLTEDDQSVVDQAALQLQSALDGLQQKESGVIDNEPSGEPDPKPSKTNTGAIVGGVIGGVAAVMLVSVVISIIRKKKK